jgi:hypothetical protein
VPVVVPRRFNGPPDSGNGGYCAGVVAGKGAFEVNLRRPVPLDTPLELVRDGDDGAVRLLDGAAVVADGRPGVVDAEVPAPLGLEAARAASARYRGRADGVFSRCFVCGRAREDALGVFAGAVDGRDLVASPWTPPAWSAGEDGYVRPEIVWAVLDCPTYFALYADGELPLSFLARLTARVDSPVRAGEEHVVIGWPLGKDGRKHHAGSAVLSRDGDVLAVARALLVRARD